MYWLKILLPPRLRLQLRLNLRYIRDLLNGQSVLFARQKIRSANFPMQLHLTQVIKTNAYTANKVNNLRLGISFLEKVLIRPGAIFSFWYLMPEPNLQNGFKEGRNLVGEKLSADIGGGLCQLSGILYHLSLMAGLEILERHPHSKDIYTATSRYTPLGSDATVVYGHKDFRIRNNLDQAIYFSFQLSEHEIIAQLCAKEKVEVIKLQFEAIDLGKMHRSLVYQLIEGKKIKLSEHDYERL